jgi:ribulose-5-phosphate 4-epimerase/fuculose-1-phosphate aldolase
MLVNDPVTQARLDLTTALRTAARHGLNEGVCNHFSMAVPGRNELFLVNPQGLHWSEVTPADLVMADGEGNVVEGKHPVEASAFFIHARIHQGNPRAQVVLHTHMP